MAIKILTKNSIDITNIDGARQNHFSAGMRSGIVKGALNEGKFFASASNIIALDTCELRISGHRVVIDSSQYISLTNNPANDTRYSMIAEISVNENSEPTFRLFIQSSNTNLVKDNLYKTQNGNGTYQLEIGRFTLTSGGNITDVVRTSDVITGGGDDLISDIEFNASAYDLESNKQPEVNVDYNEETKKYDMSIGIPRGQNGLNGSGINPNLLINGDFRVNQRGQTSYSAISVASGLYSVDRFKMIDCNVTVNADNTITITNFKNYGRLIQQLEFANELKGKTVTLSVKFRNVSYTKESEPRLIINDGVNNTFSTPIPNGFSGVFSVTKTMAQNSTGLQVRIIHNNLVATDSDLSVTIEWAKLEIGSVATAFSPRPYAEELALCQRYYQIYKPSNSYASICHGFCFNSTLALFNLSLICQMRTPPTIIVVNELIVFGTNIDERISSLVNQGVCGNSIQLQHTTTNLSPRTILLLRVPSNTSYLALDAEIY